MNFLENYKNPCWAERLFQKPYMKNYYLSKKIYKTVLTGVFKEMRNTFITRQRISTRWRMRCLPYFYVMETPPIDSLSLYDVLAFHPFIVNPAIDQPEFWNEKGPGL